MRAPVKKRFGPTGTEAGVRPPGGSRDGLEQFLAAMDTALIILAPDRRIERWRGSAESIFGRAEHAALGRTPEQLEIDRGGLLALEEEVAISGGRVERDLGLWRSDGTRFQARVRASRGPGLDPGRMVLMVVDLTREDAPARRRASEQRPNETLLAELGRLALEWQDVTRVCERATAIVGDLLDADLVGAFRRFGDGPGLELISGSGWPVGIGHKVRGNDLELAYLSGGTQPTILLGLDAVEDLHAEGLLRRSGAACGLAVSIGPVARGFGSLVVLGRGARDFSADEVDLVSSVALIIEAAATRDLAASLEEQMQQISHLESLTKLSGGIAHEFNNLLGVITNYSEIARSALVEGDQEGPVGELQQSLDEIGGAAERAVALTEQLLMFSRRDAGGQAPLDLSGALEGLRAPLARELGDSISLEVDVADQTPPVRIGAREFAHMILSLASNAKRAMPLGGVFRIEAGPAPEDPALAPAVRMVVSDDGEGMTAATRDRAFEPFFTTRAVGDGSGLGLPTVYGTVHSVGGSVDLRSEPGSGTTIEIELPAAKVGLELQPEPGETARGAVSEQGAGASAPTTGGRVPAPPTTVPHPPVLEPTEALEIRADPPPTGTDPADGASQGRGGGDAPSGAHILLVEDDEMVRRLTKRMLAEAGHEVSVAPGAAEALEQVRDGGLRPDLILTDVVMPEMTGVELVNELAEVVPEVAVAFMSGYTSATVSEDVVEHGAELIEKPFTPQTLLGGVSRALGVEAA